MKNRIAAAVCGRCSHDIPVWELHLRFLRKETNQVSGGLKRYDWKTSCHLGLLSFCLQYDTKKAFVKVLGVLWILGQTYGCSDENFWFNKATSPTQTRCYQGFILQWNRRITSAALTVPSKYPKANVHFLLSPIKPIDPSKALQQNAGWDSLPVLYCHFLLLGVSMEFLCFNCSQLSLSC